MLRTIALRVAPPWLLAAYRARCARAARNRHAGMSVEEVFTEVYAKNFWGGERGTFRSGSGSALEQLVRPYVEMMQRELTRIGAQEMTVVDLGCGDFEVGRQLAGVCGHYTGVDVVRPLVEHNRLRHGTERVSFEHLDLTQDELPPGGACIVRQVFQHLSNRQIAAVLLKLSAYRYCYITEHHPSLRNLTAPNLDKPHGPDIRLLLSSGVFLEEPPFSLPRDRYELLLETFPPADATGTDPGVIRTFRLSSG